METTASVRSRAWTTRRWWCGAGASARGRIVRARPAGRAPRPNLNRAPRRAARASASARPRSASTVLNRDASFGRRLGLLGVVRRVAQLGDAAGALASLSKSSSIGAPSRPSRPALSLGARRAPPEPQDRRALLLRALPYGFGGRGHVQLRRLAAPRQAGHGRDGLELGDARS